MIRSSNRRGSLIVAALLLFSILLALGLGLMSSQASRMRAAVATAQSVQAKSLALAAWADVKTKLGKDLFFPPTTRFFPLRPDSSRGQEYFSYSEDVYDDDGELYGTYTVVIDVRYERVNRAPPVPPSTDSFVELHNGFFLIRCMGKVGGRDEEPSSERTIDFEVSMQDFRVIRILDRGSL